MPTVSVIVLNWNGLTYLKDCLVSLENQTYQEFSIIVVDNGSTDGSQDYLRQNFPHVQLLAFSENLGFASGNNAAIRQTDSDFIATINNDIILDKDWLREMVSSLSSDDNMYSMAASKILLFSDRNRIDSTGIELDKAGMAWNRHFGLRVDEGEVSRGDIFGPNAAAALYRRELFDDIGLFDEDYFAFYEDVDLAWRARLRGWRCQYIPTAVAFHHHSATAGRNPKYKNFLVSRNKSWTILKNYPSPQMLTNLLFVLFYELAPCMFYLFRYADASRLRGKLAAMSQLRQVLEKRKRIQSSRQLKSGEDLNLLVPPKNPFKVKAF